MLKLLTSPLTAIGGLACTVVLAGLLLVAKMEVRHLTKVEENLRGRLATAEDNYNRCKTNRVALQAGLDQCNVGAENTARVATIVANAGTEAFKSVQKNRPQVAVKVEGIKAMPTATCDDALQILREGAK